MTNPARPAVPLKPIEDIARSLGIAPENVVPWGRGKAKIELRQGAVGPPGKLILVTAMTPTPAGEGKTTTVIGLADALNRIGVKAAAALREPSLGPVFGMKGGATGGGRARVVPSDDINLHFTGDMHAVTSAHNLLAAMVDNHLHYDSACGLIDIRSVRWRRVLDMDDRSLRSIVTGLGDSFSGIACESGFDITAASEVMAVLCLSRDLKELKERLGRILVAASPGGAPVTAAQINAVGAMAALLRDALRPNLVQTLEGTPAFIHGGPFANIAHGTNSVIATRMALGLADAVVTECGFASDLGAEKFFDIVVRSGAVPPPSAVVIVATARSLKYHGGAAADALGAENAAALAAGFDNLRKHVENVAIFGLPIVVGLNRFPTDTEAEIRAVEDLCLAEGVRFAASDVYNGGGAGGEHLAREVMAAAQDDPRDFKPLYPLEMPLAEKIGTIARRIYGAAEVGMDLKARKKLLRFEKEGAGGLPVCVAKTQYSLSDDPKRLGRPRDFTLHVTDASLCAGAGFVVALCGEIMTMPGLPRAPQAEKIDVSDDGEITGIMG